MSLATALEQLDAVVPDDLAKQALRALLCSAASEHGEVLIELGDADGGYVRVPADAELEIVTKAFFKEYLTPTFGDFRIQIAIGGTLASSDGPLRARLCFATLLLNAQGQRFTTDFHLEVR
jgi:hypothetical protein